MNCINGIKRAKDIIGEFNFHEFCCIDELKINRNSTEADSDLGLKLTLRTKHRQINYKMEMSFHGVRNLYIQDLSLSSSELIISGFDIIDVSDRQLEDIFWQINDFENNQLSFYCKDIEINEIAIINRSERSLV